MNRLVQRNSTMKINKRIPKRADKRGVPKPRDVAHYRNNVEENEKIYFCGWWDNTVRNEKVQEKNLNKTRKWLSEEAYKMCKKKNISSCWTANQSKEIDFNLP